MRDNDKEIRVHFPRTNELSPISHELFQETLSFFNSTYCTNFNAYPHQIFQITTSEQQRTIQELERRLDELEQLREKQAKKIAGMMYDQDAVEADKKHTTRVTQATVQSISNELDRMKQKLDEAGKREKQVCSHLPSYRIKKNVKSGETGLFTST